jgi:hypothetical protein
MTVLFKLFIFTTMFAVGFILGRLSGRKRTVWICPAGVKDGELTTCPEKEKTCISNQKPDAATKS